ncbi:MAG: hypothetical protein J2P17_03630 [Mycobacterium sp.]|nr:hypothetical protein [Mycobacterium sp.]
MTDDIQTIQRTVHRAAEAAGWAVWPGGIAGRNPVYVAAPRGTGDRPTTDLDTYLQRLAKMDIRAVHVHPDTGWVDALAGGLLYRWVPVDTPAAWLIWRPDSAPRRVLRDQLAGQLLQQQSFREARTLTERTEIAELLNAPIADAQAGTHPVLTTDDAARLIRTAHVRANLDSRAAYAAFAELGGDQFEKLLFEVSKDREYAAAGTSDARKARLKVLLTERTGWPPPAVIVSALDDRRPRLTKQQRGQARTKATKAGTP